MIKTKKIFSRGIYIFESRSSGNSNYIESLGEAKRLMAYAKYYLKGYLLIHDYVITRHGWQMAVEILDREKFEKPYDGIETWRIISERVRLWLSTYVRSANFGRKREGVLVREKFRKYYFESKEEALGHLEAMRNQQVRLYQRRKKYRGIKSHYRIKKEAGCGSIFLCSKEIWRDWKRGRSGKKVQQKWIVANVVGEKMVDFTLNLHNSLIPPSKPTNSS